MRKPDHSLINAFSSPYGLAALSSLLFLFAWLLPPSWYAGVLHEPDLMYLDATTFLFFSFCALCFVAGVAFCVWLSGRDTAHVRPPAALRASPVWFLMLPLLIGATFTVISLVLLIRQVPTLFLLLLSQRAGELKETMATQVEGRFTFAPLLLTAVCWWYFWRSSQTPMTRGQRRVVNTGFVLGLFILLASSIVTVSRNLLMPAICGLAILALERRRQSRGLTPAFLLRGFVIAVTLVLVMFVGVALLRGGGDLSEQLNPLAGYSIASYNRLAAVVNGKIHYPYGGSGNYLSSAIVHTRLLPFAWVLNPPASIDVWASEFQPVSNAGLDVSFIWSGAFGYVFADSGWFAGPVLFVYGALTGFAWVLFQRGSVFGIVFYPWTGFCILFWIGSNLILDSPIEVILATAILLSIYEALMRQPIAQAPFETVQLRSATD